MSSKRIRKIRTEPNTAEGRNDEDWRIETKVKSIKQGLFEKINKMNIYSS